VIEKWQASPWWDLSNTEILQAARELAHAAIDAYLSMVGGLIPAAWISEALFTFFHRLLVKCRSDPEAAAFLLGYDSAPIQADKSLYALAGWARQQGALAGYLDSTPAELLASQLNATQPPGGISKPVWDEWCQRFHAYLASFGHMIYDLDFANPVPADQPAPLLETLKLYLSGEGSDPEARQHAAIQRREAAVAAMRQRLKGWRRKQFERWLALAQRFAPLREDALADVGLAYPLLRQIFYCLGERFAQAGAIELTEQIYWLTQAEVAAACQKLDQGVPLERLSHSIPERQAALRAARKATPPRRLPYRALPWHRLPAAGLPANRGSDSLAGVPASAGRVTAQACVLHGPEDFSKMACGDVLVARLTTPAWTPLFARAAAIVTDVGGPLSHGSIVAREYGIPAVLGAGKATQRIQNGQVITVDGDKGRVYLQP
jgi:pyruvate,water dikinase